MIKVKMLVTTNFKGKLLKAGDVVEVDDSVAKRWRAKSIALIGKKPENKPGNEEDK